MSWATYEIGNLEAKIRDLEEKNTILKAERDDFKRQRDEVLGDMTTALDGWLHCAICEIDSGDEIEAEKTKIDELRRKYPS